MRRLVLLLTAAPQTPLYLTLPFSLLVFLPSPSFLYIQTPLLSKLKGTSKCPGSLDTLSRHQTLWPVWGGFCQGQSALEVGNSCITGSFSPWHLWAGALPVRITSGSVDHLQIQGKRKHNKDIFIRRNKKGSAQGLCSG